MKQLLPQLRQLEKHLSFTKTAFTKGGFRHATQYINGLIVLQRKSARQISHASLEEKHHSAISNVLSEARFKQELLEQRYLKKIRYLTRGFTLSLLFDDTLVKREGKHVAETQSHKDHRTNGFLRGHQFFTAMIHTSMLQLPLFPQLYSKNSTSKIEMAHDLIDKTNKALPLTFVLFDSWYSDKKLIKKCLTRGLEVVCAIKTNRNVSPAKGCWERLSTFSKKQNLDEAEHYWIDEVKYQISSHQVKLKGIPPIKLLVSKEWNEEHETWSGHFHLISTNARATPVHIIRTYRIRWHIETLHRDMKQHLGFAKGFMRKPEGIVRHAIFVTLAYTILKLYMHQRGLTITIGECIRQVQDEGMDDFVREIVEIEDRKERIQHFENVFIRKTAKV